MVTLRPGVAEAGIRRLIEGSTACEDEETTSQSTAIDVVHLSLIMQRSANRCSSTTTHCQAILHDSSCSASHALFFELSWFPLPPILTDIFPAALTRVSATRRLFMPAAVRGQGGWGVLLRQQSLCQPPDYA